MKIKDIEFSKLKPSQYNPRQITIKQVKDLKKSIEKFGIVKPIVINSDYTIIGGHQRFAILKEATQKVDWEDPPKIPCVILDLSKEDERELNIRLNKNGGDWDFDLLSNFEIEELKDWGFKEIELGLNIDKIEENKPEKWLVSIKTDDVLEAEKIHLELKEQGYNPTLKKSV
jgi:ParB-like chromosome segregation protein Spo0J